jgi:AGCS family alanine or glycine:cation symporter
MGLKVLTMECLDHWIGKASDFMWGTAMLVLLFGTHLFLTFRLRFVQRYLGRGIRISLRTKSEGQGDISQFGVLTTALAATIGTGASSFLGDDRGEDNS